MKYLCCTLHLKEVRVRPKYLAVVVLAFALLLPACSRPSVRCTSPVDNPAHHYLRGMVALEDGDLQIADDTFARAAYCDKAYSPVYSGLALLGAETAQKQGDERHRAVAAQRIRESLQLGKKYANEPADEFYYYLARIRLGIMLKEAGWLKMAEEAFDGARKLKLDGQQLLYYQGREAANYFMGLAYLEARDLHRARERFAGVLDSRQEGKWHEKAERAWKKTDKVLRALAGFTVGEVGTKIALQDSVSRSGLAALLMGEMKLDKMLVDRTPDTTVVALMKGESVPTDILSHPFRTEILLAMQWKIRGFEPKYDETARAYLFHPAESVSRGEMALILDDVLIKLRRDGQSATAGLNRSPFSDVRPASPYFNAVLNVTSSGIMEGDVSGEFRINDVVDGAEAILALRMLQEKVNLQ